MNRTRCLVCSHEMPWWQKIGSNSRVGIECRACHSIMKNSRPAVLAAWGLAIGSFFFIHLYVEMKASVYLFVWVLLVALAAWCMASAKLELVYENKHRENA